MSLTHADRSPVSTQRGDHLLLLAEAVAELEEQAGTERRRAEAAEDRLRMRTLLFAEADHKMKTTVAVLAGWARTLDDSWHRLAPEDRRAAVAAIRRSADELAGQAEKLLEEARAEMAIADLRPVRMDLSAALAACTADFSGVSERHPVRFEGNHGVWARVDPGALQQVLGQQIENGVMNPPPGGGFWLRARSTARWAELRVIDYGLGIPEGIDLFAPFQRGDTVTRGAGLGLYIVANLVEAMGGSVSARRNRGGEGSTFVVRLPGCLPRR
ncbi:MAG: sensor histidine kinase [Acidimicrobiales bacterium]